MYPSVDVQLGGDISEEKKGRFASADSLPQICGALEKAAYDPRVCGIYIKVSVTAWCISSRRSLAALQGFN